MAGWDKATIRSNTKKLLVKLRKEKNTTEGDLIQYALIHTFKKKNENNKK